MGKDKTEARLVVLLTSGLSKAVSGEGWTPSPAFRLPASPRQMQQDTCTMNGLRAYADNKQEIIDGFKYLNSMQASG